MGRDAAASQRRHGAHDQIGAQRRQRIVQLAAGHIQRDRQPLGHQHRPGIQALIHQHGHHAGFRVACLDRAVDGGRPAPARQQRGMDIDAAKCRRIKDRLRQDQAIRRNHRDIGLQCREFSLCFAVL